jgi:hypothetical protein
MSVTEKQGLLQCGVVYVLCFLISEAAGVVLTLLLLPAKK